MGESNKIILSLIKDFAFEPLNKKSSYRKRFIKYITVTVKIFLKKMKNKEKWPPTP